MLQPPKLLRRPKLYRPMKPTTNVAEATATNYAPNPTWEQWQAKEQLRSDASKAPHVNSPAVAQTQQHLGAAVEPAGTSAATATLWASCLVLFFWVGWQRTTG